MRKVRNPTERLVARIRARHLFMVFCFLNPNASFCGLLIDTDGKNFLELIGHLRLQEELKARKQGVALECSIPLACVMPWVQFPSTEKGGKMCQNTNLKGGAPQPVESCH